MRARINLILAGVALVGGGLAAVGGSSSPRRGVSLDVAAVTHDIERERDRISALELARWIRDARPSLRVVDLRSADAFQAFHVPGAQRMTFADVVHRDWEDHETVVLYGDDGVREAQAWVVLRAQGVQNVYHLRYGVQEWTRTIASPTLPANPTPDEAAQWRDVAEMSRWFGGVPRVSDSVTTTPDSLRAAIGRIRRRGC